MNPPCVIGKSMGRLYYKDNFQTPKFTSIFTDFRGDEYRQWTFTFTSIEWRKILNQDYYVKKTCADNAHHVVKLDRYQLVLTPFRVVIKYNI